MRRAGEVVRTAQGVAVVRVPDEVYPDVGTTLVGENLEAVGRVVDVFGPVERPDLAVSPAAGGRLVALVGRPVDARGE